MKRIFIILSLIFSSLGLSGQNIKQDNTTADWIERNKVVIPFDLKVHTGVTRNGNPKYYFIIKDIIVYISPSNYQKYKNREAKILLVEWYNPHKDLFRYTTQQYKEDCAEHIDKEQ